MANILGGAQTGPNSGRSSTAQQPPNLHLQNTSPGIYDRNAQQGDLWLVTNINDPEYNALYYLADFYQDIDKVLKADWIKLEGAEVPNISFLTQDGTAVPTDLGIVNVYGTSPLTTNASGNQINVAFDGTVVTTIQTDHDDAEPSDGVIEIIGDELNTFTAADGNTVLVAGPELTNGVVISNSSGKMLTSTPGASGTYLKSNGPSAAPTWGAGSSGGAVSFNTDNGTANESGGFLNIIGDDLNIFTGGSGDTVLIAGPALTNGVVISDSAGVMSTSTPGTSGYVLTSNGPSVTPTWQATGTSRGTEAFLYRCMLTSVFYPPAYYNIGSDVTNNPLTAIFDGGASPQVVDGTFTASKSGIYVLGCSANLAASGTAPLSTGCYVAIYIQVTDAMVPANSLLYQLLSLTDPGISVPASGTFYAGYINSRLTSSSVVVMSEGATAVFGVVARGGGGTSMDQTSDVWGYFLSS